MPEQTRVLLIAPYFFPRNSGGAVQLYDGLIRRFQTLRTTVLSERQGATADEVNAFDWNAPIQRGYDVRRMDRMSFHLRSTSRVRNVADGALFFAAARWSFRRHLSQIRPDIVVCGGVYTAGWLLNMVPDRITRVNYVLGEELTQATTGGPWSRYLRRQQVRALRLADANIALSRFTANALAQATGTSAPPVHLQLGCVDTDRFRITPDRDEQRIAWGWADRTVLLTVARLVPRKGIDRVLYALASLRLRGRFSTQWLYVIAGRGPEDQRLRDLVGELGLSNNVRFAGFVPDDKLPALYNATDVFILANRDLSGDTEGFGLVFLEATACGLPVIGGAAGGTGDVIEHDINGLRVDVEDDDALADAISLLMSDLATRQRLASAGSDRVRHRFSISDGAAALEDLLLQITKVRRAAARPQPQEDPS